MLVRAPLPSSHLHFHEDPTSKRSHAQSWRLRLRQIFGGNRITGHSNHEPQGAATWLLFEL